MMDHTHWNTFANYIWQQQAGESSILMTGEMFKKNDTNYSKMLHYKPTVHAENAVGFYMSLISTMNS
jgi:hypothetical protein